ncbi:MAG TPA: AMIN domain-containing protein, partial [Thermoanaerobaculaceae bacterium]|nr:AMIN domain-containing protein [Thermoanaerobaculaceae bacterium]
MAVVAVAVLSALLAGVATAQEAVSVLGMAWTPKPAPALVISASGPLKYTRSSPEAGVVVVDFPDTALAAPLAAVEQPDAGLRHAALQAVDEGGTHLLRLRLEVDPGVNVAVAELPSGIEVRFAPSGKGEAAPAASLTDVLPVVDATGVSVQLIAPGPLDGKLFTLANPPRVVVDFKGVVNKVARRIQPVGAAGVQRVRVAQHATAPDPVVRVVVDLDQPASYHLAATPQGAVLRIGGEPAAVAATQPAAPAPVEPAAPVTAAVSPTVAPPAPVQPAAAPAAPAAEAPAPAKTEAVAPAQPAAPAAAQVAPPATQAPTAPAPEPTQAEEPPVTPVKIVNEPAPTPQSATPPKTEPAPAAPQPAAPPSQPAESLVAPPAAAPAEAAKTAAPAESPWTSSQAAMAEQAAPPTTVSTGAKEVESQEKHFTGEPISLELKDADIKDVLRTFAKITGLNVVVDPGVSGSVTVNLENVPWDQCLDIILRINGLDYVVENNVLRVARIDTLTRERGDVARFKKAEEEAKPMRTVTKTLSYAKVDDVKSILTSTGFILSERGSVVTDPRTNQLIIRDSTDRMDGILNLIDSLDQPNAQVIIEARIVETTRTFSQAMGVAWGFNANADATHGTNTGWKFPNTVDATGGVNLGVPGFGFNPTGANNPNILALTFADVLNSFNLDFLLSAAETKGLVRIVSSPKVTAQNNLKAHIQSGVMIPIQTVANNTVTVQYVDATLALDVTPHITAEGTVLLDIDLKKRQPVSGINIAQATNVPIL